MCRRAAALVLPGLLAAGNVRAQEPAPPRIEAGADVSSFQVPYWPTDLGAGAHATGALTPLIASEPPPYSPPGYGRRYRPAIDAGTVIETPLWHRLVWRVDVSDLIAFYPAKSVKLGTHSAIEPPAPAANQIVVTSGLAWRF